MASATGPVSDAGGKLVEKAGGPARLQVILLLAAVLALDTADKGTVSAIGGALKQAFDIGNTRFGLLLAVVSFAGALGALPMGRLVDMTERKRLLLVTIVLWAVAMAVSGVATSYMFLLVTRIFLGLVTAVAWPAVASLTGDFFPARERSEVYGLILAGELAGVGIGYFTAGQASSWLGWHWAFYAMSVLSLLLAGALWRWLPEPRRGGQGSLEVGETDPAAASEGGKGGHADGGQRRGRNAGDDDAGREDGRQDGGGTEAALARRIVQRRSVKPRDALVLHEDPRRHGMIWAIRYCLGIPSYRLLILASALAYYFFSGVRAFTMIYFTGHYGLSQATVSTLVIVIGMGALVGVIGGGRLSHALLERGRLTVRIVLPAIALALAVPFLGIGIWVTTVWLGVAALTLGALIMAAAIAPLDAARQDIMHPLLWGRAEAGRMTLRMGFEGTAPLAFGFFSRLLGGGTEGLMWTFLIMLAPMLVGAILVYPGRHTYPRDVATAAASVDALEDQGRGRARRG